MTVCSNDIMHFTVAVLRSSVTYLERLTICTFSMLPQHLHPKVGQSVNSLPVSLPVHKKRYIKIPIDILPF